MGRSAARTTMKANIRCLVAFLGDKEEYEGQPTWLVSGGGRGECNK